jgi:hypothetical protein
LVLLGSWQHHLLECNGFGGLMDVWQMDSRASQFLQIQFSDFWGQFLWKTLLALVFLTGFASNGIYFPAFRNDRHSVVKTVGLSWTYCLGLGPI